MVTMASDPLSVIPNMVDNSVDVSPDVPSQAPSANDTTSINHNDSKELVKPAVVDANSVPQPGNDIAMEKTDAVSTSESPLSEKKIEQNEIEEKVEAPTKTTISSSKTAPPKEPETKSPSTKNKAKSFFKSLPRTVRWRIQLGLLSLPTTESTKKEQTSSERQEESMQVETVLTTPKEGSESDPLSPHAVTTISTNEPNLKQSSDSKPSSTPKTTSSTTQFTLLDIIQFNQGEIQNQQTRFDLLAKKHLWESSPLALIEQDDEDVKETQNDPTLAKVPKEPNNNPSSPTTNIKKVACHKGSDPLSAMLMEESVEEHGLEKGDSSDVTTEMNEDSPSKKGNASWSEFYSSRETLDIIEKDLHRLSPSHHIVTPISILYSTSTSLTIQEKTKDANGQKGKEASSPNSDTLEERKKRRSQLLSQLLFIYARHNPSLGYRQGMVDFHNAYNPKNSKKEETISNDLQMQQQIFQKDKVANDIFALFETIMYYLSPAYDSDPQSITAPPHLENKATKTKLLASTSMSAVGESVLQQVRINGSDALYSHLTDDVSIPPQLYCARWVRLIFTREISSVHQSLFLWDKIFHSMYRKHCALLPILEYICAAMILRIQDKFNIYYSDEEHEDDFDDDPNDSINALMNYSPIDDVKSFWKMISEVMEGKLVKASMERNKMRNMNQRPHQPAGLQDTMNKVQSFARPFLEGAGRAISGTSQDQNSMQPQEHRTPQLHINGVFKKVNNMYHEAMGQQGRDNGLSQQQNPNQYQPLSSDEFMKNKHVHGERYHAEQVRRQNYEQRQKDQVKQTLKKVSNTWNKAIDSIGGSIENLVVNASARGNQNSSGIHRNSNLEAIMNRPLGMHQRGVQESHANEATANLRLKQSVNILTRFLQIVEDRGGTQVPPLVWQAVAEVDAVRMQMLVEDAKNQKSMENMEQTSLNETQNENIQRSNI